jgi:hypothetical protein
MAGSFFYLRGESASHIGLMGQLFLLTHLTRFNPEGGVLSLSKQMTWILQVGHPFGVEFGASQNL